MRIQLKLPHIKQLPVTTYVLFSVLFFTTGNVVAATEEAPSNAKLYQMILDLKAEQAQLRAETNKAKTEAIAAKNELARTKRELASLRQQPSSGTSGHTATYNSGVFAKVENTSFTYGQEGGVADLNGNLVDFDRESSPRIEVGYVNSNGTGIRGRHWSFDHSTKTKNNSGEIGIDTHYFDLEVFQRWQPSANTELEGSVGLRKMEFTQTASTGATRYDSTFDGWGGTAALQAKRKLGIGKVYGRSRYSLLFGDSDIKAGANEFNAYGNPVHQVELALGYELSKEFSWGQLNANLGYEWQYWTNLGMADTNWGGIGNDDVLEDISFQGWTVGVGADF